MSTRYNLLREAAFYALQILYDILFPRLHSKRNWSKYIIAATNDGITLFFLYDFLRSLFHDNYVR